MVNQITNNSQGSMVNVEKRARFRVAAIQMASGPSVTANLEEAARLIEEAVAQEAELVVLPEYFCIMGMKDTDKLAVREQPGDGQIQDFLSETAKRLGIWLAIGLAIYFLYGASQARLVREGRVVPTAAKVAVP